MPLSLQGEQGDENASMVYAYFWVAPLSEIECREVPMTAIPPLMVLTCLIILTSGPYRYASNGHGEKKPVPPGFPAFVVNCEKYKI